MVARVNPEMFSNALHTPLADAADSEDVRLALETARVLEAQGDNPEAARWIRRAVEAAENAGKDERVLVLARAVADLTASIAASKENVAPSSVPTLNVRGRSGKAPRPEPRTPARAEATPPPAAPGATLPSGSIPPMLAALISSIPPFSSRESSAPPPATPSSPPPAASPAVSPAPAAPANAAAPANDVASTSSDKPLTARTMRIGSIRVAISGSLETQSLSVERLEKGQPVPAGAMEAMLVLTGEIDGSLSFETHLPVANRAPTKS